MKVVEGKNSQNTTSFLSRKNIVIVRSKLNRIFHTLLASCVERFLPRHDAFFSFPDSILPGFEKCVVVRGSACGRFFFFFSCGTDWNPFKLPTISHYLRPSTRFIPARKNHFLLPLSKITLPERDGFMHEHFKQRHCSNTWSNKLIWSVTIQPIVWSMVRISGSFNCDIAPCNDQPSDVTCFSVTWMELGGTCCPDIESCV